MKAKYLVVIEKGDQNYSAFSPDVPGCVATGRSVEATIDEMRSALEFHLEGIVKSGDMIPNAKGLDFYIHNSTEVTGEDILAHVIIDTPEMALV